MIMKEFGRSLKMISKVSISKCEAEINLLERLSKIKSYWRDFISVVVFYIKK